MEIYRRQLSCGASFLGVKYDDETKGYSAGIGVPFGSAHDPVSPRNIKGVHHFTEHALLKPDNNAKRLALAKKMEFSAGYSDATADMMSIFVYFAVHSDAKDLSTEQLVTMTQAKPEFTPEQLDLERRVVLEEVMEYEDDTDSILWDLNFSQLYLPPFSDCIVGVPETIGRINSNDVLEVWRKSFHPKVFNIVAVGNVDFEEVSREFENRIEKNSSRDREFNPYPDPIIRFRPPSYQIGISNKLEKAHLIYTVPAPNRSSEDYIAFEIVHNFLTRGRYSSYLFNELREKRGLVYSFEGGINWGKGFSHYNICTDINPSNVRNVIEIINGGFEEAGNMDESTLKMYKDKMKRERDMAVTSPAKIFEECMELENSGAGAEAFRDYKQRLERVTLEQIRKVCQVGKPTITILSPREIRGLDNLGIPRYQENLG